MSQEIVKNWKGAAFASVAKYYEIEAERASFEERLAVALAECEKLGVTFRYGDPDVDGSHEAVRCPCGSIVALTYEARQVKRGPDGILHCAACRAKTEEAQRQDAAAEGRPAPPPKSDDIPF